MGEGFKRLGRKALEEVAQIVRPETILAWHRRLIAKKFDGSKNRSPGKGGSTSDPIEELVLQLARENRTWGYRRIVGALSNLGHEVSHQTVANVLKRHDIAPAPERGRTMSWREFIRSHLEVLAAVDFFTAEVWTAGGLMTYYVLTCMRVASRQVCIAGITTSPDQGWMEQMARNISFAETGFLNGCRYLLHDRDAKFCERVHRDPGGCRNQGGEIAGAESEFERPFGKVASIRKRGVLVENDLVRRGITATGAIQLRSSFSR